MKNLNNPQVFSIFFVLCLLIFCPFSSAQSEGAPGRATIKLYRSLDKLHLNSQLKIAVKVKIENSWHINSNTPNDEFLIPTSFDLLSDGDFEITTIKFPDSTILDLSFSDQPVSVFEGEFIIGV